MSLRHAESGEVIDIRPLGDKLVDSASIALARTDDFEVMRLMLPKGKSIPEHEVAGEISLQCIEGTVEVQAHDKTRQLQSGNLLFLAGNTPFALFALENSSVLMTMVRKEKQE